jgi:hypothetical protein
MTRRLVFRSSIRSLPYQTPIGESILNPGAVAVIKVARPAAAKTYRVWLVK